MGADKANDKEPSADTSSEIIKINSEKKKWEDETLSPHIKQHPEMREEFITTSSKPIRRIYTPSDIPDIDYLRDLGFPSQ